jgi:signal transduction histidine kinase
VILLEDLTDLETLEAELVHSERLASIGRLAAGVAHEIGNPVTGIACLAQNLRHETDPAEIDASVKQILDQTKRISTIVQSLVTFSHGGTDLYVKDSFNLHEAIAEAIQLVHLSHRGRQVNFKQGCPDTFVLTGDRQRLIQVFVNLLNNACDASEGGGVVDVLVEPVDNFYRIEIRDQGKGITEKDRERIFEPFFTTKKPGEGTGLGLSLVYKIIQDHEGEIDIESEAGRGTRVIIALPIGEQPSKRHGL